MSNQRELVRDKVNVKKAIFVNYTSICFPVGGLYGTQDFGFGKSQQYVDTFNKQLEELNMDWIVELDDTNADIEEIKMKSPDLIICTNGLQKRFYYGDFDTNKIVFLTALELHSMDANRLIKMMKAMF